MKKRLAIILILSVSMVVTISSCKKLFPPEPADNEVLDGPMEGLTAAENRRFIEGDEAFGEVFTKETGLGPIFVATSCAGCHTGDGKGYPFTTLTRYGQEDSTGNKFLHLGGPQLQHRALPGHEPESIPEGATSTQLIAPAVTGLGFLDLVPDEEILAMAAANKTDPDGVRGRPNWVTLPEYVTPRPDAISKNGKHIGRFGKKAAAYDLLHQTVNAYNQDIGIASLFNPMDVYTGLEIDPEVATETVNDVVFYLQTLKVPVPRDQDDPQVVHGKDIFTEIGCATCHRPTLKTGPSPVDALSNKEFHPYTDLLLHDMGTGLDDGYTEGNATTSEWRTPPLWGLGLSPDSQAGNIYLMHDGRATSIEEAILLHGGEAAASKQAYEQLSDANQEALIKFLESL